ncbi:hypothetical protein XA26_24030 [Mycolicibacterium fortuitum]|uniref:Uncharacterized protein n=1 Tax=Mycolicibacterium fortuitum TaxID=1766 RepID=A0A0N9XR22_MYCFO|nr:hypothetical protein G155_00123 [Mycobacterium sp. VKM Ac-1817D]ALI26246.1 hypothetical protein XA26_24030 [Mycolicibacterium fortuitum]
MNDRPRFAAPPRHIPHIRGHRRSAGSGCSKTWYTYVPSLYLSFTTRPQRHVHPSRRFPLRLSCVAGYTHSKKTA